MMTSKNKTYDILGVRVDALRMDEAATMIVDRAKNKQQPATYVVKPYVEFLAAAHQNQHLQNVLNQAWLSLPDAVSLQWAAKYLYEGRPSWWRVMALGVGIFLKPTSMQTRIPERFAGTVFTWKLLEAAARKNATVYLVGTPQGSDISVTARTIGERLPELQVQGFWPGRLSGLTGSRLLLNLRQDGGAEAELLADLKDKKPDLILIGMGFPLQEELAAKLSGELSHGVLIGEGGTFDYDSFGGRQRKAPASVSRIGLEWLWRLLLQPQRLKRQLAIPRFVWAVYQASRGR